MPAAVVDKTGGPGTMALPFPRQVDHIASASNRIFLAIAAISIGGFLLWANLTVLDKVKRGAGKVVPQLQNQIVQHLEGGIVTEILVREGERVQKGAPLVRIENSFAQSELAQTRFEVAAKKLRLARLEAEALGHDLPVINSALSAELMRIQASEREVFNSRKKALAGQISILDEQSKQKKLELAELKSRWSNTTRERELVLQRVMSLRKLASSGAVSNNELLENERVLQQIEGRLSDLAHEIPKAESALIEIENRRAQATLTLRGEADKERLETELQVAKLNEAVIALQDRKLRSEVTAPSNGIVNKLFVTTIGGVVKSGEALVQITPVDSSIAVEARLSPADRAEVWPGLPAVVKISAYDYSVFGGLKGRVTDISADALQDERGQPYFRVRLEATRSDFGPDKPVVPGMLADVDVIAGQQSVMSSMLRPLRNLRDNALRQ